MVRDRVFLSYSHKDIIWLRLIKKSLKSITRNDGVEVWDDSAIEPGSAWIDEIKNSIERAKLIIFLVSPNLLGSDFIMKKELLPAIELSKNNPIKIMWIPISHSLYTETRLVNYKALSDPGKPLDCLSMSKKSEIIENICFQIKSIMRG